VISNKKGDTSLYEQSTNISGTIKNSARYIGTLLIKRCITFFIRNVISNKKGDTSLYEQSTNISGTIKNSA
ncbi:hypothetical protein PSX24_23380, partial [Shigella flexneri]|nr:hypothetical protein [Shigella flexneri]